MGFIHSKMRNRLGPQKVQMLTFIKNNYAALYENKERVSNFISNFIEDDEGSGGEELVVDGIEDDGHEVMRTVLQIMSGDLG